ncbi:MAG: tetratricopeptide repeat protein [Candidatus Rifleibacteriota bacterium]
MKELNMQSENFWTKNSGQKHFDEALVLEAEGKTSEAIEAYQKSISCWPKHGQAQYNLGVALATKGNLDQAVRAWKRAIWIDPSFRLELINAFDIDDELREEVIFEPDVSCYARAA